MIKLSVVVITLNEEKNIARCLQSARNVADEIVVMDSHSTDATTAIATTFGARIFLQPFLGYVGQCNAAIKKAIFDWVLFMDADEALSPQLEQDILTVKNNPSHAIYRFPRLTNYCGKWIHHSGWYPDKKIRLFKREMGEWKGENPHPNWFPHSKDSLVGELKGDLFHYSYYTLSDHVKQIENFTEIGARAAVARGKDCSILKIWLGPKWKFFVSYFIRLGFLDGYYGYLICKYSAWAAFAKYTKIRQYARQKISGGEGAKDA